MALQICRTPEQIAGLIFGVILVKLADRTSCEYHLDKFIIHGGKKLHGTVAISGAKNASLALMPAAMLASGTFHLHNTPDLRDITTMSSLLKMMGMKIDRTGDVL